MNGYLANGTSLSSSAMAKQNNKSVNATENVQNEGDPSLAWKRDGNVYNKGPNQILPSSAIYTWHPTGAVCLSKLGSGNVATERNPISVPHLFEMAVQRTPDRVALAVKRNGDWQKWTYKSYQSDVRNAAKAFIALGLEPHHSVCILGFNAPEWLISNLAAIYAGGFAAGIYTTNSAEACAHVAQDSKAQIMVVEDDAQLQKILSKQEHMPHLKAIIQYTGTPTNDKVYSWTKLMTLGENQSDAILTERLSNIAINQCCTLIYTSGTTGNPKGVMLSHDNITWNAYSAYKTIKLWDDGEKFISYLPLCHVAAQMIDLYLALTCSASVYFADRDALKGSLIESMKEVQPTFFLSVPRVWEKMYEKMQEVGKSSPWAKRLVAIWAKAQGLEYNRRRIAGEENPWSFSFEIANKLVLSKVKDALGLGQTHVFLCGGAPIKTEILEYFMSLNIVLPEVYGMSECCGMQSVGLESEIKLGTVGKPVMGVLTKLDNCDEQGNGEICMGGRHVQMGYLNLPDMTRETIDQDGWLHSGDIGKLDEGGYLLITGRIKELLITAGGVNVAPVPIENNVKSALPIVSQALLLGDKLKFLSILLTLKTEVDPTTLKPLNILLPSVKDWINDHGYCAVNTVQDVLKELYEKNNKKLLGAFQTAIDAANSKAISHAQKIQKWHILPQDFSIQGGEFGPTLKLKRSVVVEKYRHVIEMLYD